MLWSVKRMRGFSICASDGGCGVLDECLFDDRQWTVRYAVANIGGWLMNEHVLLAVSVLRVLDQEARVLEVMLTQQQVIDCPDITLDPPVSQQLAESHRTLDGHPAYWGTSIPWGLGLCPGDPIALALVHESAQQALKRAKRGDPHLCSTRALCGYGVQACDGVVGRVADFVIDDVNWTIRYVAIACRNWWPRGTVVVPTCWVSAIDWSQSRLIVSAPRAVIQAGPAYHPSSLADPVYETWLHVAYAQMQAHEHMIGA
jgi:hypothetical protein